MEPQFQMMRSWSAAMALITESQAVIGFRLMGMAGLWSVTPNESRRMVEEKGPAFTESMMATLMASVQGKTPPQIAEAAIHPLRRRTKQNSRRLAKRGPRIPK